MDLLKSSQATFVQSESMSASETIAYTHNSGTTIAELRVFVGEEDFHKKEKGSKTANSIMIHNVILSEAPTALDKFVRNGLTYQVREWQFNIGMYIIVGENKKRNRVNTTTFR